MHKIVKWILVILLTLGLVLLFVTPTPEGILSPTPELPAEPGDPLYTPPPLDDELVAAQRSAAAAAEARHQRMHESVRSATADAAADIASRRSDPAASSSAAMQEFDGSDTLSESVYAAISEAQQRLMNEQWEEGVNELNAIYADYDSLSHFEQRTLLNFYSNALLGMRMYDEAIVLLEQSLVIPAAPGSDDTSRPRLALGQLYAAQEDHNAAVQHFSAWLLDYGEWPEMAGATESVLLMLADAYVYLGHYADAEPALEAHIQMRQSDQRPVADEVLALREQVRSMTQSAPE